MTYIIIYVYNVIDLLFNITMTKELIKAYNLNNFSTEIMERDDFYREQIEVFKKTWKPSKAVEIIQLFLFKPNWDIILQKRADNKSHNPWLIDKSVWGHVDIGIATHPNTIISLETAQELWANITMVDDIFQFVQAYKSFRNVGDAIWIGHLLDTKIHKLQKKIDWESITIASKAHIALWVYWWGMTNKDGEVQAFEFMNFDQLISNIKKDKKNNKYTRELGYYLKTYENDIKNLLSVITQKS